MTLLAAASQLGFYYETGGEMEWEDAGAYANDAEGRKVLLSGLFSVIGCSVFLVAIAWVAKGVIHRIIGGLLVSTGFQLLAGMLLTLWRILPLGFFHEACLADPNA